MRKFLSFVLIQVVLAVSLVGAQSPRRIAIKAGKLFDSETGTMLDNRTILIENDVITAVGTDLKIPADAIVYDFSDRYVLPGLIDAHVHLTSEIGGNYTDNLFRRSFVDSAVTAHLNAKSTLHAGFTTVRNLGADAFVDVSLKRAIDSGIIEGPRMQVSTFNIASTGNSAASANHRDLSGFSPWLDSQLPQEMSNIADGPEELRKKVRYLIKYGAEVIKFRASGGVLSEEKTLGAPKFSQEEMNAIVDEARLHGIPVAAHAHGTESIKMAIRAGVTSIEHGSFIDDEGIRMMKERGTVLVADIYNDDYILAEFGKLGYPQSILDKEKFVGRTQRENFQKAMRAGVRIAYGTDAGVYPHGWNAKQFKTMVDWGVTPAAAIRSATKDAAELLGWQDRVGSIKVGRLADIIAVPNDPLANVGSLQDIPFVMKGGVVVVNGDLKKEKK